MKQKKAPIIQACLFGVMLARTVTVSVAAPIGAELTSTLSTSVLSPSAHERSMSNDIELTPWAQLNDAFKADLYLAVSKDLRNERALTFQNMTMGVAHAPIALMGERLKYRPKISLLLPTNVDDREIASLQGGINLGNRFIFKLAGIPALSSYYQLSVGKNFHGFATTALGESNSSWSVGHALLLSYEIGKLYLQVVPRFTTRWTYAGAPSTRYELAEEVGVNLGQLTVGLGHTNSSNLVQANGRDLNFSVFSSDTSNYYTTANYSF